MDELTATVDTFPDNDRFLPRYLTVQLLTILAAALPTANNNPPNLSQKANDFITSYKKPDLFTPLTYSIFWRENPEQLLMEYTQPLEELDKYSHSALTIALSNEDFVLANNLINKGAIVFLEDKLVLEIALTSILQRDDSAMTRILEQTPADDLLWVKQYIDHLYSYVIGKPAKFSNRNRDIISPIVRYFGQVLDTMVYFNGTPSHYGFISPSLNVLANHLNSYLSEIIEPAVVNLFKPIAAAFEFTRSTCKFHGNIPQADAATAIYNQLNNADKNQVIFIPSGWAGNSVAIAIINQTLILSNLGIGGDPQYGTQIYAISNKSLLTKNSIDILLHGLGNATSPVEILAIIGEMIDPKPLYSIKQRLNPVDNCIFVNPRAVIEGILLVLAAYQTQNSVSAENLATLADKNSILYTNYLNSLYEYSTLELTNFMRNHDLIKNKRIEGCSLALEYINQHYADPEALKRCIELKNALEFVGLKDYYNQNISPEAKEAIQKLIIREQEITAMRVMEQEAGLGKEP